MKKITGLVLAFLSVNAFATSIDWTGGYRIEYTDIDRPSLSEPGNKKSYGLHYLYLNPKIVASDGVNIVGRFDILGNSNNAYRNTQLGSFIGESLTAGSGYNTTGQNQESSDMRVSQLYLNVNHENGALLAGRAPIEFGLGITHNAGRGAFDHWMDTKDLIGYKFLVDNISFMPIYARNKQTDFEVGRTVSEQIYVFEYDNKDIGAKAGVFHQTKSTSQVTNDIPVGGTGIPGSTAVTGGFKSQTINLYLERRWSTFEFKLEGSFNGSNGRIYGGRRRN